jgi:hypothetical protein
MWLTTKRWSLDITTVKAAAQRNGSVNRTETYGWQSWTQNADGVNDTSKLFLDYPKRHCRLGGTRCAIRQGSGRATPLVAASVILAYASPI